MKTECNVVRDLMPLCIDGAASEESKKYVDGHMSECDECRKYYEDMKAAIPKQDTVKEAEEQEAFERVAELMKLKHRLRMWRNVLIGIMIGVLAVVGIYTGWQELVVKYNGELSTADYDVSLAQLKDSRVVVSVDYHHSKRIMGISINGGHKSLAAPADSANNPYILRIWMTTTIIPQTMAMENRNGPATTIADMDEIDLIVFGRSGEHIIWRRGEAIPQASEAMEAYNRADEELQYWFETGLKNIKDDAGWNQTDEEQSTRVSLLEKRDELRSQVPEWQ